MINIIDTCTCEQIDEEEEGSDEEIQFMEHSQIDDATPMAVVDGKCVGLYPSVDGITSPSSQCTSLGMASPISMRKSACPPSAVKNTPLSKTASVKKAQNPLLSDPPPSTPLSRFTLDMQDLQVLQSSRQSKMVCRDFVRKNVFPLKKFITTEEELAYGGKCCLKILNGLGIRENLRISWWEAHKEVVRKTINQKRTAVSTSIKRSFIRKFEVLRHILLWFSVCANILSCDHV